MDHCVESHRIRTLNADCENVLVENAVLFAKRLQLPYASCLLVLSPDRITGVSTREASHTLLLEGSIRRTIETACRK